MLKDKINIDKLIDDALMGQDDRSKRIIQGRYGLGKTKKQTLAALGNEYNLTRERVRQIQSNSIKTIREQIKSHKEAIKLLKLLERYLKDAGNIRRGELAASDLRIMIGEGVPSDELFNQLQFIADALEYPHVSGGNDDWHIVWHTKPEAYETAKKLVAELLKVNNQDFEKFITSVSGKFNMSESDIINHLETSKRFGVGPYGDLGADHWIQVNPKTVRDKIYLVLDKSESPMHFSDIATSVNRLSDKARAAATVHNELIKDPRFILVGRGTYTINA